jgi:hypothetical protein
VAVRALFYGCMVGADERSLQPQAITFLQVQLEVQLEVN